MPPSALHGGARAPRAGSGAGTEPPEEVGAAEGNERVSILDESYRRALAEGLSRARVVDAGFSGISVEGFNQLYRNPPDWAIGPFSRDPAMTFEPPGTWPDPWRIGWESRCLWNPTLIEHEGRLHMIYRAGPRKESLSCRLGLAIWDGVSWRDFEGNPILYPESADEVLSVEDPKLYRVGDVFFLFYNGAYSRPRLAAVAPSNRPQPVWLATDIKLAVSRDLLHWERIGVIVPHEISRFWAKAAVIPRGPRGDAVAIGGEYWMFVSEGCGNQQHIGRSRDMVRWEFYPKTFLDLPAEWGSLNEVACAVVDPKSRPGWVTMDFFHFTPEGAFGAGQALYTIDDLTRPVALSRGGSLAWGGLLQYQGDWLFAQGWDAAEGDRTLYLYRAPVRRIEAPPRSAAGAE